MSRYSKSGAVVAMVLSLFALAGTARAQEGSAIISGQVQGDQGRPLTGATVVIVELNAGGPVNEAGRYNIVVPAARVNGQTVTLRARFIGYQPSSRTITLAAGPQTQDFTLRLDPTRLSEVVVTGVTGETERAKVPFTVARVDTSDMPVQAVNPLSQLQGKVPGAQIASVSGRPGQAPQVILRGPTSINGNGRGQEPLYIVDGVILGSSIADINPSDIESVEVVKGAAASSLYGSRAGAGVIQIKTKRGRAGNDGMSYSVRQEYGLNDIERDFGISRNHTLLMDETRTRFCVIDAYGSNNLCSRTLDYQKEVARVNNTLGDFAQSTAAFPIDPGSGTAGILLRRTFITQTYPGPAYNAVEQLVDPKPLSITDATMSGRFGNTAVYTSAAYTKQGGAIGGLRGYDRATGRVNLEQRINDQWNFTTQMYLARANSDGSNQEEGGTGFFRLTRTPAISNIAARDIFGRLNIRTNLQAGGVQNENPLYSFSNIKRQDLRYRYLAGATLRYTPLDWLDAETNFSYDRLNLNYSQFSNKNFRTTNNNPTTNNGSIFNGVSNTQALNGSAQVTARRQLLSDLNSRFNLRWLYEQQDFDNRQLQGNQLRVSGVPNALNSTNIQEIRSSVQNTRQMSFSLGSFLDYKDRYTMDLLVREDGSSRFGRDERWQTYGRASAAWLAAREPWWPVKDIVSQATFRASYGSAGNTPNFVAQYESYTLTAGGNISPQTLGNSALKPEVVRELELGSDIELFSRYALTVTHAFSRASNQILPIPRSVSTGFKEQWRNAGTLDNHTWEASLNIPIIQGADWNYSSRVNYTHNYANIFKLDANPFFIGTDLQGTSSAIRIAEGERFGTFYGRKFVTSCAELPAPFSGDCGRSGASFQKNDEGFIVWVGAGHNAGQGITDNLWNTFLPAAAAPWGVQMNYGFPISIRENCTATPCAPELRRLGHALPDYRLGWSHSVSWKGVSLYGLFDGAFGGKAYNQGRHWSYLDFLSHDVDQAGKSVDRAKPIGYYYRADPTGGGAGIGGFYDILGPNSRFVESTDFVKLREVSLAYRIGKFGRGDYTVSLIGRNLKTWTRYTGFDPEVGVGNTNSQASSGLINAIDAFTFPQLRSFSFVISAGF